MVKGKFLIMVALYLILAGLTVFNFNLYHHITLSWGKTINQATSEEMNENIKNAAISVQPESLELSSESDNIDRE